MSTPNTQLYLLEMDAAKSSWKKRQQVVFQEARKWDRHIFSRTDIYAFHRKLDELAATIRNSEPIREPDFDFAERYNARPSICIGYGCQLSFTPILGKYE